MKVKSFVASIPVLRFLGLKFLKKFNYGIKWKHDITKRPFFLELYRHKGYWYYGTERDIGEIDNYRKLIKSGFKVLEVGAHIGYNTQFFEELVGDEGKVLVLEPSSDNILYLEKNILPRTKIIRKAASNRIGKANLYKSDFGGFTNSLIQEFAEQRNKAHVQSNYITSKVKTIEVEITTLDNICLEESFHPDFIKIDVEGVELNVLRGASTVIASASGIMVETYKHKDEIVEFLKQYGFYLFCESGYPKNLFFKRK